MGERFPLRKKDWTPGDIQFGLFVRTGKGSTIALTCDCARPPSFDEAIRMLTALRDGTEASDLAAADDGGEEKR